LRARVLLMKNIYHSDIYQFNTPVSSYWEDHSNENLNLDKLNKDISSEIVVKLERNTNNGMLHLMQVMHQHLENLLLSFIMKIISML